MKEITKNDLLLTYSILKHIMKEYCYEQDTSFVRVKNILANLYCDKELEK